MSTFLQKGLEPKRKIDPLKGQEREDFINSHIKAISEGNLSAINSLGNYYLYAENDLVNARNYFEYGTSKGYQNCIINLADFYRKIKEYDLMVRTYNLGIEKGNTSCMCKLAQYYEEIDNEELMIKYYLMAFSNGEHMGAQQLAIHYKYIKKDYDQMIKYFNLAIEEGFSESMYGMGVYYEDIVNDYELMKKYYLMAIEKENPRAMFALGYYYERIEKNYDLANKYYLMGEKLDHEECILGLAVYYKKIGDIANMINYYEKLLEHNNAEAYYEMARYQLFINLNTSVANFFAQQAWKLCFDRKAIERLLNAIIIYKFELEGKNENLDLNYNPNPSDDEIIEGNQLYKLGLEYLSSKQIEKAKETFILAIRLGNVDSLYSLGKNYYIEKKHNSPMMKKCLKLAVKYKNHEDSLKYLVEYYNFIHYNPIQAKRYLILSIGKDAIISQKNIEENPYLYDPEDDICVYTLDSDNNVLKKNLKTNLIFKIEYSDSDENCYNETLILNTNI